MPTVTVTKTMRTETAHRLMFHKGLCKNLHGHSYKWEVTVGSRQLGLDNMVVDFGLLKMAMLEAIEPYDHATVLNCADKELVCMLSNEPYCFRIIEMPYEPTAEAMCQRVADIIGGVMIGVDVMRVRVWETETSFAEYCPNAQE